MKCPLWAKSGHSFDQLVGAEQEGFRDRQANCLGRPKVDSQLKSRRVLYCEVGRLGTFENSIHVVSYAGGKNSRVRLRISDFPPADVPLIAPCIVLLSRRLVPMR